MRQGSLNTDPFGLAIGDTVKVIATSLNCRATPSPNGTLISTEASGQLGTIDNGSVSSGGYIWWYIAYTDGNTGWSAEGTGSTAWLQNVTGQNTSSVAYNRTAAMYYAAHYWNVVTSDGYFWNGPSTYVSLAQGTNVTNMSGDDCAHFVSQVIGDEPHQPGGGLNIPSRVPPTYGEPGNAALGDLVINNGWGVVVPSVTDLL
ncbi:MAG: amidase domain-containing protein, partial [Nitrososphaerota archaeon]|nr:amidase domain-containing protein [Nitrososphaerota archaeon]